MPLHLSNSTNSLTLLKQLSVAFVYWLLGNLIHQYVISDGIVSILWPSSGLALAALLIGGKSYTWAVLLGALVLNAQANDSAWAIIGITITNVFEARLGLWLLTHQGSPHVLLRTLPDFFRLILLGGVVSCFAGALIAVFSLYLAGYIPASAYMDRVWHWWMGDTLGVIMVTTFMLSWQYHIPITRQKCIETVILIGLTFVVGQAVFLDWFQSSIGQVAKGYWMFFFVSWVAIRLEVWAVTAVLIMTATQAFIGALLGKGDFADDIAKAGLHNYWYFVVILSLVGMAMVTYVHEIKHALAELKVKDHALNAAANGIVITDAFGKIEWANQAFSHLTGYSVNESVGNQLGQLVKSGKHSPPFYQHLWSTILANNVWRGEIINRRKNGTLYDEEMTISPMVNDVGEISHFVAVKQDICERKKLEKEIYELAFFDPLTHLPNRRMLNEKLGQAMTSSKNKGTYAALMVLDLDNFKTLNDTQGHASGDSLLQEAAHRLVNCVGDAGTAARFGGDEFVVVLTDLDHDKAISTDLAMRMAEKIRFSLAEPYILTVKHEGQAEVVVEHHCTVSIGAVVFSDHEATMEEVFKWADATMYEAKRGGRNLACFYHLINRQSNPTT